MENNWTIEQCFNAEIFDTHLVKTAQNIFEYTQFLLDNDENLTRTGNLNKQAKAQLHLRINELLEIKTES